MRQFLIAVFFGFFAGMSVLNRREPKTAVKTAAKNVITSLRMQQQRGECCASDKNRHASMATTTSKFLKTQNSPGFYIKLLSRLKTVDRCIAQ